MELKINIEEYITPEEIKTIAMDAVRESIISVFRGDEANINRLISNLSYEFIFKAVSDAIGEDAQTIISDKVKKLMKDESCIRYELWRKKDTFEKYESPAIPMLHKAIEDNKWLLREMVTQSIARYEFSDVQDAIYNALNQIVYDKVFGKEGGAE